MMHYRLEGHTPVAEPDFDAWACWYYAADRHVALTELPGGVVVSTVFLGRDHDWSGNGPPILFESMTFRGESGDGCERYATWEEAEAGHAAMVAALEEVGP